MGSTSANGVRKMCVPCSGGTAGAKAMVRQCRIGVGAGCSLEARTPRAPPSDTPVQNQARIPWVRMAVRYPGPPLPRPLGEPFRRGDESPLWMGPDVYAGTLHASPLHPYQRGGHPLSSGYWIGGAWSGYLRLEKLSVMAAGGRARVSGVPPRAKLIQPHACYPAPLDCAVPPHAN